MWWGCGNDNIIMSQENVTIYLHTPLSNPDSKNTGVDEIACIKGKIISESAGGFVIQVKAAGNGKKINDDFAFKKIFIPQYKIDFMVME